MSVVVVATITPKADQVDAVRDALLAAVPRVHAEPGCELYAVHEGDERALFALLEGRIEAVKLADDRSGDVVVRVYESLGGRAATRLRAAFRIAAVEVDDLLERPLAGTLPVDADGSVPIALRPFQITTLRLRR